MKKKREVLKTKRLILKSISYDDEDTMAYLLTNEDIKRYYMIPDFKTKEEVVNLFKKQVEFCFDDKHFEYGIYLNDELIGFINECEIKDDTIELGYVISPKYQNKGYATESLKACIDELFDMGFNHIIAGYFIENVASRKVMEKAGMKKLDLTEIIEYKGIKHISEFYGVDKL